MNIACPECSTIYRVDPARVPDQGTAARCRECGTVIRIDPSAAPTEPGETVTAQRVEGAPASEPEAAEAASDEAATVAGPGVQSAQAEPHAEAATPTAEPEPPAGPEGAETADAAAPGPAAPAFGPQDPETRAERIARALVSDIKVYHPEKWEESAEQGTLREDFREEILKSWEEYVEQVGEEMAKKTPYFRDALNEILARGDRVF